MQFHEHLLLVGGKAVLHLGHLPSFLLRSDVGVDADLEIVAVAVLHVVSLLVQPVEGEGDVSIRAHQIFFVEVLLDVVAVQPRKQFSEGLLLRFSLESGQVDCDGLGLHFTFESL